MDGHRLRAYGAGDLPALVALTNQDRPEYRRFDVEDAAAREPTDAPDPRELRLVAEAADGDVIGYVGVSPGGLYNLDLVVDRAHRRRGLGAALLARASDHARAAGIGSLRAWSYQEAGEASPAACFFARHGFVQGTGRLTAFLDLAGLDAAAFAPAIVRVEAQGVRLIGYHDLPGGPADRARLRALVVGVGVLSGGDDFEAWARANLDAGGWAECLYVAEAPGGEWVGLSNAAWFCRSRRTARIPQTAVRKDWRNRGLATALKALAAGEMRRRGAVLLLTANRVDNAPMLEVNRRFGFQPGPLEMLYERPVG